MPGGGGGVGHSPHDWLRTSVYKKRRKGLFCLTYDVVDIFCKKGIFFAANRTLGVPEWVSQSSLLFRAENGIGKQCFENLRKIVKTSDMIGLYELQCLYLK